MHPLIEALRSSLAELTDVAGRATELCDQASEMVRGLDIEELAELSLILRAARERASEAKSRCTSVRDTVNKFFVLRMEARGTDLYRTPSHTFSADVEAFYRPPHPEHQSSKFQALAVWLQQQGADPFVVLLNDKALTKFCNDRAANGLPMPPHIARYLNTSVRITQRTGARGSG